MPDVINVLIVDDHTVVRKGLKQIIQEQSDMQVGGEAANGQDALDMLRKEKWDVLVLDIFLPFRNGMEILQEVRNSSPHRPC